MSIGGGDDIQILDESKKLVAKILELGAKNIEAKEKPSDENHGLR